MLVGSLIAAHETRDQQRAERSGQPVAAGIEPIKYSPRFQPASNASRHFSQFRIRKMVQKKDGDDGIEVAIFESSFSCAPLHKCEVRQSREPRILVSLSNCRRRQIDPRDRSDVRSQQQFRIADAAAQAKHARFPPGTGGRENSPDHVPAQLAHRRLREMLLREAGIKRVVMRQFPRLNLVGQISV